MMCNPTKNVRLFHISSECLSPRPTFSKSRSFSFKSNNSHHHHHDDHDDNGSIHSYASTNSFKIKPLMKGILLHPTQLFHTSSSSSSDDNNHHHHKHGPKVWTHGKEQRPSVTKSVLRRGRFAYTDDGDGKQQQQVQVPPEHKNSTSTIDTLDESTESSLADDSSSFFPPVRLSFSSDDTEQHEDEEQRTSTTTISLPTDRIKLTDLKTEFVRVPSVSSERSDWPVLVSVEQVKDSSTTIVTDQKKNQVEEAVVEENGNTTTSSSGTSSTSSTTAAAVTVPLDSQISDSSSSSQVSFGSVEIYTFGRMVGDNPSVSRGPPITISYRHIGEKRIISINDYERKRRNKRLTKDEMKLDPMDRLVLLKASGATLEEINHAKELARDERLKRIESAKAYFKKQADASSNNGKKKFSLSINDMTDTMNGLWKKVQISSHLIQGQT